MNAGKPKGDVRVTGIIATGDPNKISVTATIECMDSEGTKFSFSACYFVNELSPYNPKQVMPFGDWRTAREEFIKNHPKRWYVKDDAYRREFLIHAYMKGTPFDQVPGLEKGK